MGHYIALLTGPIGIYMYVHCAYIYVAACILILGNCPFNWGISYIHACMRTYVLYGDRAYNCSFLSILDHLRILTGSLISWRNYAYKNVNHCSDVRELEGGVL